MPLLEKQPTSVLFWRLAIALAALLLYLPTLGFEFTMDDVPRVERNPLVLAPVDGPLSLLSPFTHPTVPGDLYRPVVDTTFRLTSTLISSAPSVAHAINIGLHVVVSLLVFQLFLSLFSSMTVAGAGALVFAIHPIHVGAISNISGRYELCAALFGLLGCLLSIAWQQATRPRAFIYAVASGVALLLAALSKESGLVFVGLILLTAIASSNKVNATRRFLVLAVCLIIAT